LSKSTFRCLENMKWQSGLSRELFKSINVIWTWLRLEIPQFTLKKLEAKLYKIKIGPLCQGTSQKKVWKTRISWWARSLHLLLSFDRQQARNYITMIQEQVLFLRLNFLSQLCLQNRGKELLLGIKMEYQFSSHSATQILFQWIQMTGEKDFTKGNTVHLIITSTNEMMKSVTKILKGRKDWLASSTVLTFLTTELW